MRECGPWLNASKDAVKDTEEHIKVLHILRHEQHSFKGGQGQSLQLAYAIRFGEHACTKDIRKSLTEVV